MKIVINILKAVELIITSIWGIIFGILTPIALMGGGLVDETIANHFVLKLWLINSVVFYITGTVIVMLKHYKIALCFHTVGMIISIVIYGIFRGIYSERGIAEQSPAQLYMPIIFVFFITLAIAIIANRDKIKEHLNSSREKKYEAAPSVLGGEYSMEIPEKKKRKGKQ